MYICITIHDSKIIGTCVICMLQTQMMLIRLRESAGWFALMLVARSSIVGFGVSLAVLFNVAIILLRKRELVALLYLSSCCRALRLFTRCYGWSVILEFVCHNHLLLFLFWFSFFNSFLKCHCLIFVQIPNTNRIVNYCASAGFCT